MTKGYLLCSGVRLDIKGGPIGIMVSGGVDSAILLYYLMKYATDTIHIYTTGSNLKYRRNSIIAPRVVEKCIELTGNNNVVHHIHYDEEYSDNSLIDAPQKDLDKQEINTVYDGTTMNPPHGIATKFVPEFVFDYTRNDSGDNAMSYKITNFICHGLIQIRKASHEMYRDENLIESLLPVTRSCEWDPTCDYFDNIKDPGLEHCGECWWCKEKEWGFK